MKKALLGVVGIAITPIVGFPIARAIESVVWHWMGSSGLDPTGTEKLR